MRLAFCFHLPLRIWLSRQEEARCPPLRSFPLTLNPSFILLTHISASVAERPGIRLRSENWCCTARCKGPSSGHDPQRGPHFATVAPAIIQKQKMKASASRRSVVSLLCCFNVSSPPLSFSLSPSLSLSPASPERFCLTGHMPAKVDLPRKSRFYSAQTDAQSMSRSVRR